MRGLTGSEIVILLALKKNEQMSFEELDALLKDPSSESSKTTKHWIELLENKRLIVRSSETKSIFRNTEKGDEKAQDFLRITEPFIPTPIVLM